MGKADRISGSFWLVFSIFVSYQSYKLGLGALHQPGPGFLFFWAGLILAALSLTIILKSFRMTAPAEKKETIFRTRNISKIVLVLISILIYGLLLESLGFLIVTVFLFLHLLGVVEKKKWSFTVLVSLIISVAAYLIFDVWLQSQFPKGILEFLRF